MPDCAAGDIKSHPMVDTIGISKECSWRIGRGIVHIVFAYQVGKGSTSDYILGYLLN